MPGLSLAHERDFSPYLDFSSLTQYLRPLQDNIKLDYVLTEEQRNNLLHSVGDLSIQNNELSEAYDNFRARNKAFANRKAPVEQERTIYFDPADSSIHATDIKDGTHAMVNNIIMDLIISGKLPLINVHTHSKNKLHSAPDYRLHLQNAIGGMPAIRASIVICPDIQYLAVITKETQNVMPDDDIEKFITAWDERIIEESENEKNRLENQMRYLSDQGNDEWYGEIEREMKKLASLVELQQNGKLGPELTPALASAFKHVQELNSQAYNPQTVPEYKNIREQYERYLDLVDTKVRFDIASTVRVKLFSSTNMADFYAFDPEEAYELSS